MNSENQYNPYADTRVQGSRSSDFANPYAPLTDLQGSLAPVPGSNDVGMVNQVTIVGILQIVMGCMELFLGALLVFYAFLFSFVMPNQPGAQAPPPQVMFWVSVGLAIVAAVVLFLATLRIIAGIYSFWFRGRIIMFISLIAGFLTSLTFYCAPFSVGLGIYGLIVMMHPGVRKAYEMAKQGMVAGQIRDEFARARFAHPPATPMPMPPQTPPFSN